MIRQVPDPVLRQRSQLVVEFDSKLVELGSRMTDIRARCRALGLAAVQVGVLQRVVALNPGRTIGWLIIVNPEIVRHGGNQSWGEEGCLSIDGGRRKFRVRRWDTITVRFQDLTGKEHEALARAEPARTLQHEIDHLDGRLIDAVGHAAPPFQLDQQSVRA